MQQRVIPDVIDGRPVIGCGWSSIRGCLDSRGFGDRVVDKWNQVGLIGPFRLW